MVFFFGFQSGCAYEILVLIFFSVACTRILALRMLICICVGVCVRVYVGGKYCVASALYCLSFGNLHVYRMHCERARARFEA